MGCVSAPERREAAVVGEDCRERPATSWRQREEERRAGGEGGGAEEAEEGEGRREESEEQHELEAPHLCGPHAYV